LGLSGGQVGTGRALFLATSTLLLVEAEEIWVEAKAPVRTRAATAERTMNFMDLSLFESEVIDNQLLAESAGIGAVGRAGGNGKSAIPCNEHVIAGGGRRDLGGSKGTGENEGGNGGANDEFHGFIPF